MAVGLGCSASIGIEWHTVTPTQPATQQTAPPHTQGLLLFAGLLLLLWVPLLLFSSAAPTFVIPKIQSHGVNATLHATWGSAAAADFPLCAAGGRRQCQQFLPDDSSLPEELSTQGYRAAQFQLLCTGQDADAYWDVTPPARQALVAALAGREGGPDVSLRWVKRCVDCWMCS